MSTETNFPKFRATSSSSSRDFKTVQKAGFSLKDRKIVDTDGDSNEIQMKLRKLMTEGYTPCGSLKEKSTNYTSLTGWKSTKSSAQYMCLWVKDNELEDKQC
jgi:hypothetical protein